MRWRQQLGRSVCICVNLWAINRVVAVRPRSVVLILTLTSNCTLSREGNTGEFRREAVMAD